MIKLKISDVFKIGFYFFTLLFIISPTTAISQELFINEFLASNSAINSDPDFNGSGDWIEIYNAKNNTFDLSGYFLTDNLNDTTKWLIPDGASIAPNGFLLIWADGKDAALIDLHANFKLSKSGEEIGLFNPEKILIDSVIYKFQITDISSGRKPDGNSNWYLFDEPTPNSSNITNVYLMALPPQFSLQEGFYTESQVLELSNDSPSANIHYTLNGDDPTEFSPVYSSPLQVKSRAGDANVISLIRTNKDPHAWLPDWVPPAGEIFKATIVRARIFEPGKSPSKIITKTYFVDPVIFQRYPTIPVISLVTDNKNLFDEATGIYVPGNSFRAGNSQSGNYFKDWEKPAHIEFFKPGGEPGFAQDVGIKIQGGTSPASPQKGLHVFARSIYSKNRIDYPLFKDSKSKANKLTEFKRFIIRAWGSTINAALFNDAFAHRLMEESDLDIQAYRPAVVFINGEYWGLHEIREANKNSWYYHFHYGIDREDPGFDILEHVYWGDLPYAAIDEGDAIHWNNMRTFLNTHDMSEQENYEYIKTQIDVDNFINYLGHCVYCGKWDWPNNNDASWRPSTADAKWKWVQYDMETGFGVAAELGSVFTMLGPQFNMIKHVIDGVFIPGFGTYGPHPLLPKLLENDEFKNSFINWFDVHLDLEFAPTRAISLLNEMAAEIEPYMQEYKHRWPFSTDMNNDWHYHLDLIRNFINVRQDIVRQHLLEQFGSTNTNNGKQDSSTPKEYTLSQNYPNPFNKSTIIKFQLPKACNVAVKIYNTSGQEVATLADKFYPAGYFVLNWDSKNFATGLYYYSIQAGKFKAIKKMVIIK
ncbi:CotH kinase family protein [candidate division KSB1 bacterium]|nr:CotH kinase family protein [candidate division KSB1 bacterium]